MTPYHKILTVWQRDPATAMPVELRTRAGQRIITKVKHRDFVG